VDKLWISLRTLITDQSVSRSLDVSRCVGSVGLLFSLSCWLPTPENFTECLRGDSTFPHVPMGSSGFQHGLECFALCGSQNVSEWCWMPIGKPSGSLYVHPQSCCSNQWIHCTLKKTTWQPPGVSSTQHHSSSENPSISTIWSS
jgi:hypothetical protein